MEIRKLNFFDRIVLRILGFDYKRVERWIRNRNVLTDSRYNQIKKEWQKIGKEIKSYKIKKDTKKTLRELENFRKKLKKLDKKRDKGDIFFDSFGKFRRFCWWFEPFFLRTGIPLRTLSHEKEHANVFWRQGVKCKFGWKKLYDKSKGFYFTPFVDVKAPEKIYKKSLRSVKDLSPGDEFDLNMMKK